MKLKILIYLFVALAMGGHTNAQLTEVDSLKQSIHQEKNDTARLNAVLLISKKLLSNSLGEAILYAEAARELAYRLQLPRERAQAYKTKGIAYYMEGKSVESIENYEIALSIFDSLGDKNGISNILSNEGAVYFNRADDAKALELYLRSLSVAEEINDTLRILTALQNIGAVYFNKVATHDKALEYYLKALPLSRAMQDDDAIGTIAVNVGEIYLTRKDDVTALRYFKESLVALKNSENLPYSLNMVGKLYQFRKEYEKAASYHLQAYEMAKKLNVTLDKAQGLLGLGDTYMLQGKTSVALGYYKQAEQIAKGISSANHELKEAYEGQANAYADLSDFKNAFLYQTLLNNTKDSLYNIDTDKKLSGLQFNFDIQKKETQINLLTKDKELQELDLKRQKIAKNALIGGLVLASFIAVIIYRGYRQKMRTNKILDSQKAEIEHLLLNILPVEVAEELQRTGSATPRYYEKATVLFTDFKGFSQLADKLSPQEVVSELNECFIAFDEIIENYGLEKIKTIGDSYMCAGGIPIEDDQHVVKMIQASLDMQRFILQRNINRSKDGLPPWDIRIGINTGPLVAGVVGRKKYAYDIWGGTVNVASRMESSGEPGRVNISEATYELIKDKYSCTHRGKVYAKNIGDIDMYFIDQEAEFEQMIPVSQLLNNGKLKEEEVSIVLPKLEN